MAKPRKSTRLAFIDAFCDFPVDVQERLLDDLDLVHRQAKRSKGEKPSEEIPPRKLADPDDETSRTESDRQLALEAAQSGIDAVIEGSPTQ